MFKNGIIEPVSIKEFTNIKPEENGSTFHENALIKSRFASKSTNYSKPTIADDSGICIENLDNKPGIFSSRWALKNNYSIAFNKIKTKLNAKGLKMNGQNAKLICVLALIEKNKKENLYKGILEGKLIFPPRGISGFGYDPIFIPNEHNRSLAEMGPDLKNKLSHRKKAIGKLIKHELFKGAL